MRPIEREQAAKQASKAPIGATTAIETGQRSRAEINAWDKSRCSAAMMRSSIGLRQMRAIRSSRPKVGCAVVALMVLEANLFRASECGLRPTGVAGLGTTLKAGQLGRGVKETTGAILQPRGSRRVYGDRGQSQRLFAQVLRSHSLFIPELDPVPIIIEVNRSGESKVVLTR